MDIFMITVIHKEINTLIDDYSSCYYDFYYDINLSAIACPHCKEKGHFHRHGFYFRSLLYHGVKITLPIGRIYCTHCGRTHALLPAFIIPYRQITLQTSISILMDDPTLLEEYTFDLSYIKMIKKQFHDSFQYLFSNPLSSYSLIEIIKKSFIIKSSQFMQLSKKINTFIYNPT